MADKPHKPRAIFICYVCPAKSARVLNAARAAKSQGYELHVVGFDETQVGPPSVKDPPWKADRSHLIAPLIPGIESKVRIGLAGLLARLCFWLKSKYVFSWLLPKVRVFYQKSDKVLVDLDLREDDLVFISGWQLFFVAQKVKQLEKAKLYYDLNELSVVELAFRPLWKLLMPGLVRSCEAQLIAKADVISSVIPDINQYTELHLGMRCQGIFVPNYTDGAKNKIEPLHVKQRAFQLIYLGLLQKERRLEFVLEALAGLPAEIELVCQGYGQASYIKKLKSKAADLGLGDRLKILDPVSPDQVTSSIRGYLAGVCILNPRFDQFRLAQPNKIFQYLSAGLPVLVSKNTLLGDQIKSSVNFGSLVEIGSHEELRSAISDLSHRPRTPDLDDFLQSIEAKTFSDVF